MRRLYFTISFLLISILFCHAQNFGWQELGADTNALNANGLIGDILVVDSSNIYACGNFTDSSGYYYVAHWNGANWSEVASLTDTLKADSYIGYICMDSHGNLYAAGDFTNGEGYNYVAKWDGNNWSVVGTGQNALFNEGIYGLCIDKFDNIYVAGMFYNSANNAYVAKWDGQSWSEVDSGGITLNEGEYFYSLYADTAGNIYAGGTFTDDNGYEYVAKFDGTAWSELGTGANALNANNAILAIQSDLRGNIYATGQFSDNSGFQYIAKWDGSSWGKVGTNDTFSSPQGINALYADKLYNIYAGGYFADPEQHYYVAKWNNTAWSELGTGHGALMANGGIKSVGEDKEGGIYAAGFFTDAGGYYYVARYQQIICRVTTTLPVNICGDTMYSFNGRLLDTAGMYYDTLVSVNNCDSIVILQLTFSHTEKTYVAENICNDSVYNFNGRTLDTAGIYADTIQTVNNCDSIIILRLSFNQSDTTRLADSICATDSVLFNGAYIDTAGIYTANLHTQNGCDSVVILALSIAPAPVVTFTWDSLYQQGDVTLVGNIDSISVAVWGAGCNDNVFVLTGGSPPGGYYSGFGVSGDTLYALQTFNFYDTCEVCGIYDTITYSLCGQTARGMIQFVVCEGIPEIPNQYILNLYPNPAHDYLTVEYNGFTANSQIEIIDVLSRVVKTERVNGPVANTQIDIAALSNGLYFLRIVNDVGVVSGGKFSVVR